MKMECVITHDGKNWILENAILTLSAPTLEELDARMRDLLRRKGILKKGERAEVLMTFDNSTIPSWIRQYAQHYFNRVVEVEGEA
jgi:hypothetical protein